MPKNPDRLRLTIEGDEELMRQVAEAFNLQCRLCLGQFEEVGSLLISTVQESILRKGYTLSTEKLPEVERKATQLRWDALMGFRDSLSIVWESARNQWYKTFHSAPLDKFSPHLSLCETRAYTLWKWMEHYLLHMHLTPDNENLMRVTVHYDTPSNVAKGITVTLEKLDVSR